MTDSNSDKSRAVSKGELKAKLFEYLRAVERTGEPLIVTDRGIPTTIIYPIKKTRSVDSIFGPYRNSFKVHGDLFESENSEWGELE